MMILFGWLFITSFVVCSVYCIEPIVIPETCSEPVFFSYPDDCKSFYMCFNGRPLKRSCEAGMYWDDKQKTCDRPNIAMCKEVPAIHPGQRKPTPKPVEKPKNLKVICYCKYCYFTTQNAYRLN